MSDTRISSALVGAPLHLPFIFVFPVPIPDFCILYK